MGPNFVYHISFTLTPENTILGTGGVVKRGGISNTYRWGGFIIPLKDPLSTSSVAETSGKGIGT